MQPQEHLSKLVPRNAKLLVALLFSVAVVNSAVRQEELNLHTHQRDTNITADPWLRLLNDERSSDITSILGVLPPQPRP
jgi:hypothetical protein